MDREHCTRSVESMVKRLEEVNLILAIMKNTQTYQLTKDIFTHDQLWRYMETLKLISKNDRNANKH